MTGRASWRGAACQALHAKMHSMPTIWQACQPFGKFDILRPGIDMLGMGLHAKIPGLEFEARVHNVYMHVCVYI